jgi:hypothetical protein
MIEYASHRGKTVPVSTRSSVLPVLIALVLGAMITWIDTRPTWDDTGITAGLIFLSTAALGFIRPARAWLFALAVALWIPVIGLVHGHQAPLLALLVGFAGAFIGAGARRLITAPPR